jgi:hypothetical protein
VAALEVWVGVAVVVVVVVAAGEVATVEVEEACALEAAGFAWG